jgi:hypothetical protein
MVKDSHYGGTRIGFNARSSDFGTESEGFDNTRMGFTVMLPKQPHGALESVRSIGKTFMNKAANLSRILTYTSATAAVVLAAHPDTRPFVIDTIKDIIKNSEQHHKLNKEEAAIPSIDGQKINGWTVKFDKGP